jgi:hypothetical protein
MSSLVGEAMKTARPLQPFLYAIPDLRDVAVPATTNALRLFQKVFAIAERFRGVLIDCHRDGLNVLVAPAFPRR